MIPDPAWENLPAPRRFELFLTVQPGDLDDLHHVNNTIYLSWCEQVARQHALSLHLGTPELLSLGAVPVARTHTIQYLKPALQGDRLRVRTLLTHSAGVRSVRQYTIDRVNASDPAPVRLVECQTDWVWIDPGSGRPRRVPALVLERFGFQ